MRWFFLILLTFVLTSCNTAEEGSIHAYMCPSDECRTIHSLFLNQSDLRCAFFDLSDEANIYALYERNAHVLIDHDNHWGFGQPINSRGYMHHKFCVTHDRVMTSSLNPTFRGLNENNNNVVLIQSHKIAKAYRDEWDKLSSNSYHQSRYLVVNLSGSLVENYFCPDCTTTALPRIIELISHAQFSIQFMTFSFTHDAIAHSLVHAHQRGVAVEGIIEKRMVNGRGSIAPFLIAQGINVLNDTNPATMHHKVLIIDKKIVITGSMNPTNNGITRNNENVLIIHDEKIAQQYHEEFLNLVSFVN